MAGGPVEREDREAGRKPLLATEEGGSSRDGLESSASSSSIAVVVASTAVAVAGSFEFGISVCPFCSDYHARNLGT
jgi:MFS transporter, SP family, ERD6-like sugar transporter